MKKLLVFLLLLLTIIGLVSCKKEKPKYYDAPLHVTTYRYNMDKI